MNRLTITICFALLCIAPLLSAQQTSAPATPAKSPGSVVTLSDSDNGKTVELKKGATLIVQLVSNATTGYSWSALSSSSALKLIKSDYKEQQQKAPIAGAPGVQTLVWKAEAPGTVRLQLEYRRPWEKNIPASKSFSVTLQIQ